MNLNQRIEIFQKLHQKLSAYTKNELSELAFKVEQNNPWFTESNFYYAFDGVLFLINDENLKNFSAKYTDYKDVNKKIGLVLAGNIPAIGFHDVLVALLSGGSVYCKLSSEDKVFIPFLIAELGTIDRDLAEKCHFVEKLNLDELDCVVATGSDNTARYFAQYFSKKPNLIRTSRTSVAILDGTENELELEALIDDIVLYYGLGCRNVSKILLLGNADIIPLLQKIEIRKELSNFSKYDNNYLYYKSIYLVNREPFLDTENMLFKETELLHSPISVLYYQRFGNKSEIENYLTLHEEKLQCVIGKGRKISFGQAQHPSILDYADGVDLRVFLAN
jgi:hypothetical protein